MRWHVRAKKFAETPTVKARAPACFDVSFVSRATAETKELTGEGLDTASVLRCPDLGAEPGGECIWRPFALSALRRGPATPPARAADRRACVRGRDPRR